MSPRRWRLLRGALTVTGFTYLFAAWLELIPFTLNLGVPPGIDTFAYWMADPADPYRLSSLGTEGAYLYSPVFAQLFSPLRLLPIELAYGLWVGASVAALWWMRVLWTVAFPPVLMELYAGNIHILYAAAIVAGMRWGAAWALPLLTKVTPGVGIVWFAVRREWRPLLGAIGVSAGLVLVSFVIDRSVWFEWRDVLAANRGRSLNMLSDQVPLVVRLGLAAALVGWGALTDRRWTIPVAVVLAMPVIWPGAAAVLVAVVSPRLAAVDVDARGSSPTVASNSSDGPAHGGPKDERHRQESGEHRLDEHAAGAGVDIEKNHCAVPCHQRARATRKLARSAASHGAY